MGIPDWCGNHNLHFFAPLFMDFFCLLAWNDREPSHVPNPNSSSLCLWVAITIYLWTRSWQLETKTWRFPKMEVPPVIIHLHRIFHHKPSILGSKPLQETPKYSNLAKEKWGNSLLEMLDQLHHPPKPRLRVCIRKSLRLVGPWRSWVGTGFQGAHSLLWCVYEEAS